MIYWFTVKESFGMACTLALNLVLSHPSLSFLQTGYFNTGRNIPLRAGARGGVTAIINSNTSVKPLGKPVALFIGGSKLEV